MDQGGKPEAIFLSTFTEKAALQLKEGLRAYLGTASTRTGTPYDLSKMYVGTVHSLCQKLITDRRFHPPGYRPRAPAPPRPRAPRRPGSVSALLPFLEWLGGRVRR